MTRFVCKVRLVEYWGSHMFILRLGCYKKWGYSYAKILQIESNVIPARNPFRAFCVALGTLKFIARVCCHSLILINEKQPKHVARGIRMHRLTFPSLNNPAYPKYLIRYYLSESWYRHYSGNAPPHTFSRADGFIAYNTSLHALLSILILSSFWSDFWFLRLS